MNQPTVLIFSDDPEFVHTVMARWQTERSLPSFVVITSETRPANCRIAFDLAVVGALRNGDSAQVLEGLNYHQRPVVFVAHGAAEAQAVRSAHPRVLVLNDYEGWVNAAVLLAAEALRRVEAVKRARSAEHVVSASQKHATLGRYMLEMRPSLNNALTSILGNSELILLEPGALSGEVREQVSTIHSMTLRVHEIIQRFTSLECEMQFAEKQSHSEISAASDHVAAGN